ncbi:PH domain-containing protein [Heterostelium album PN500]|uniref:PH domain-containing protein n=1 Tax=Heterostelium pallidum (strain ATCC 26659 / Pp 5 / PN500) TaxID=670386 RepID=D3B823_HETP5|nr:PH domain-containing protein [Heterostelium album PN500]EFA82191.1 PH domain-containing protein [Heterostelium album PN500]|eukprot:XP_020434308.1 PH domain-containing protein [Heterostelium album PN500]
METKSSKEIIDDLNKQLTLERARSRQLVEEVKQLKDAQLRIQLVTENEEEYITNKFMKYLHQLKKEKEELALKVEQEEEYLTNTLQKKMLAIMKEKIDLENQLEAEEEFIVNKLQKQIQEVMKEKKVLEKRLESEINDHKYLLKLEGEVIVLREKIKELEGSSEHNKEDLVALKSENFVLSQKIAREQERITKVNNENTNLLSKLEIGDERNFNKQKRNRSISVPNEVKLITPSSPSPKVAGSVPISRARSASSNSNPCLIAKVLKEGWIKIKVDTKIEKRYCELCSNGELREYLDDTKQVLMATQSMDNVVDITEIPGTPSLSTPLSSSGSSTLELLISPNNKDTSVSYYSIDKNEFSQWKNLMVQLMPKPPTTMI